MYFMLAERLNLLSLMSYVNISSFKNIQILRHTYFTHFCGSGNFKREYEWREKMEELPGAFLQFVDKNSNCEKSKYII